MAEYSMPQFLQAGLGPLKIADPATGIRALFDNPIGKNNVNAKKGCVSEHDDSIQQALRKDQSLW